MHFAFFTSVSISFIILSINKLNYTALRNLLLYSFVLQPIITTLVTRKLWENWFIRSFNVLKIFSIFCALSSFLGSHVCFSGWPESFLCQIHTNISQISTFDYLDRQAFWNLAYDAVLLINKNSRKLKKGMENVS